jgi:hypothetical protein
VAYPVRLRVQRAERYSRLTTFFRGIMVIPHLIWLIGYSIAAAFVTLYAWFAILGKGAYPKGALEWQERYLRYASRVGAFYWLLTDSFPPFHGRDEEDAYPNVSYAIERTDHLSRTTTALRVPGVITNVLTRIHPIFFLVELYLLPANIVAAFLFVFGWLVSIVAWFAILITGRFPATLFELIELPFRYGLRVVSFSNLVIDRYPWFQPESEEGNVPSPDWDQPLPPPSVA